jgi:hypothetical protein
MSDTAALKAKFIRMDAINSCSSLMLLLYKLKLTGITDTESHMALDDKYWDFQEAMEHQWMEYYYYDRSRVLIIKSSQ